MNLKHVLRNSIVCLAFATVMSGCQTYQHKQFQLVKAGQEKGDVLEIMGSPDSSRRWKGTDRWTYIFYDKNERQEKEIHFEEGKAIYIGDRPVPLISAEEEDRRNEESNKELAKARAEERSQASNETFEEYVKRTTPSSKASSAESAPSFIPVDKVNTVK